MKHTLWATAAALALSACGAGDTTGTGKYSQGNAPVMVDATRTTTTTTQTMRASATATNNEAIDGYCFSSTNVRPSGADTCFQASATKVFTYASTTEPIGKRYVWARNTFGNVSETAKLVDGTICSAAGIAASAASSLNTVCMQTSQGEMVFELEAAKAPLTVANFLGYVNRGFYASTVFHRIVTSGIGVVQGGGFTSFTSNSANVPRANLQAAIKLEAPSSTGLSNTRGTITMARTTVLDSATSQFFINAVDNTSLDTNGGGYAVFGRLISGNDTLDKLKVLPVVAGSDVPSAPPTIYYAEQLK